MAFISIQDFDSQVEKQRNAQIRPWRELTLHTIYRIDAKETVPTKYGKSIALYISGESGDIRKVWAPKHLATSLETSDFPRFIRPLGLKESWTNPGRSYFSYDLI